MIAVVIPYLGGIAGLFVGSWISDRTGRRVETTSLFCAMTAILLAALIFVHGMVLTVGCPDGGDILSSAHVAEHCHDPSGGLCIKVHMLSDRPTERPLQWYRCHRAAGTWHHSRFDRLLCSGLSISKRIDGDRILPDIAVQDT